MEWITPDQYPRGLIANTPTLKRGRGNPRTRKHKRTYKDILIAFDIESSRLTGEQHPMFAGEKGENEQAVMYVWAVHLHHHCSIVGRTWAEFQKLLQIWAEELEDSGDTVVIWIHNLSYEFQFMRAIHSFATEEVFAIDSRKVLKCNITDCFEFRCSYLHSNMSLAEYTNKMDVQHKKLSGDEFDYKEVRYPWTPLGEDKIRYLLHDVVGLCEALEKEMEIDGDNLYTIPLTSTGYVRRDARKAMQRAAHSWIYDILPTAEVFEMLREAFRGGDTHANRYYAMRVIKDVKSADRSSSYPDVQCNRMFPMGSWYRAGAISFKELMWLINVRRKAVVMRVALHGVKLIDEYWGFPYISRDKCRRIEGGVYDNGRVLFADYLEITITDIDLRIILDQYEPDSIDAYDVSYTRYGYLPEEFTEVAKEYYRSKTELKGVEGMEVYYTKSKNLLNSLYGMSAQNPAKQSIDYVAGAWIEQDKPTAELLEESYKSAFQSYAWGVWTTAWARWELQQGLKLAGDGAIYCDTDSVKYIGDVDWTEYNNERIAASKESGAYATDPAGVTHYMGVYEMEKTYAEFATLGAKKYAFRYSPGGETFVTIAGVTKKKGGAELDRGDKYGRGLERFVNLNPPFVFRDAGGTEAMYNDFPEVEDVTIDGHRLEITPNVVIRDSTYTLGITAEYECLLQNSKLPLDFWGSTHYN